MATNPDSAQVNTSETASAEVPRNNWAFFLLRGVLAIALGVLAILYPMTAVLAFTMVFAAFAFANGIFSVISGIRGARHNEERWWALVLSGLVGVAVGVIFLAMPALTTVTYAIVNLVIIAAWSIMTGVLELLAAFRLRKEIVGEWLLALAGVLSIALGFVILLIVLTNPLATIVSVGWIIGIYALALGIVLIVQALRLRNA